MLASTYTFGDLMWSMLVFFSWVLFFWLLWIVFGDLFGRHDIGGWGKAGWTLFVIVLPFLGCLIYFIAEGKGMGERRMAEMASAQAQMDARIRTVAASSDPAEQIARAKELRDSGAITQEEFEALKQKALA
jgi:hypothetical protein